MVMKNCESSCKRVDFRGTETPAKVRSTIMDFTLPLLLQASPSNGKHQQSAQYKENASFPLSPPHARNL